MTFINLDVLYGPGNPRNCGVINDDITMPIKVPLNKNSTYKSPRCTFCPKLQNSLSRHTKLIYFNDSVRYISNSGVPFLFLKYRIRFCNKRHRISTLFHRQCSWLVLVTLF